MNNYNFEEYVKTKHAGQTRWNGKSYFDEHCVKVSQHVFNVIHYLGYNLDNETKQNLWATGLGHDLIEDTDATFDEIEKLAGINVADAIYHLTKQESESYCDYIVRVKNSSNFIAGLVKLADLECNMSDLRPGSMKDKYELAHHIIRKNLLTIYSN
jgi:(p)ppGpp synthase/HD superfamily hydrolase